MGRTARTAHNVKRWYKRKVSLLNGDYDSFDNVLDELEQIAKEEIENAKSALPLVDYDSRLGYEPTMEYMGHRDAIEWKLDIVERMLRENIPALRRDGCVKNVSKRDYPRGLWD